MPEVAFETLGLETTASAAEVRRAFRRQALRHHPDHNQDDPGATERFKRLLRAYRVAMRQARNGISVPETSVGPRPDRFECAGCGDCFPFRAACSRCGLELWDRNAGPAVRRDAPAVARMIAELESRPEVVGPTLAERLPLTGMVVSGSLLGALFTYQVGPVGIAMLLAGFAAYVTALEAHRRAAASL